MCRAYNRAKEETQMIELIVAGVAAGFGYLKSRDFVARRLRYVDGVRSPMAPIIAGTVAAAAAVPVVALLPVIGTTTAVLFGAAVGVGTHMGVRKIAEGSSV
jgi:hypothetical protein